MKRFSCTVLAALALTACAGPTIKVEPVTVKPIHLTIDVNLRDGAVGPATPATRRTAQ